MIIYELDPRRRLSDVECRVRMSYVVCRTSNLSPNLTTITACFENHAQDRRVRGPIFASPTFGHSNANSMGVSGNNPLLVCFFPNQQPEKDNHL